MAELPQVDLRREFGSDAARADPRPVYARLRALGPVLRSKDLLGTGHVLPRHAEVTSVIRDPRFGSDRARVTGRSMDRWWTPSLLRLLVSSMVLTDPPQHRRLRTLVQKAFTPARVEALEGRITQITDDLLDAAARKPVVDLMADLALPLPLTVIAEMLGVPPEDRATFRRLLHKLMGGPQSSLVSFVRSYPDMVRLNAFLRRLVALRRREPADDLVTALVRAEADGDRLSEDELISMVFLLLFAPRFPTEDVEIAGVPIARGSTLLIGSANLDDEGFPDAGRFDITRNPNRHVSFGLGAHYCLGAPLARLEARIAIPALLRRFERIGLAVPSEQLRWRPNIGLRGLESLPLVVTPAGRVAA